MLQLGGGSGARFSPASLFICLYLRFYGPLSLLNREAAEIYSAAKEGTDKVNKQRVPLSVSAGFTAYITQVTNGYYFICFTARV